MSRQVLALAALIAALAVPTSASATTRPPARKPASALIVGTWEVQVTPSQAQSPAFTSLATFTRDGSLIDTPGPALGSWRATGENRVAFAFKNIMVSPTGAPAGRVVVRAVATVTPKVLSGRFTFHQFDPTGNTVASGTGTFTAKRFHIPRV